MTTFQEPRPPSGPVLEMCICAAHIMSPGLHIQGPFKRLVEDAQKGETVVRHHNAACPVHAWMNVLGRWGRA